MRHFLIPGLLLALVTGCSSAPTGTDGLVAGPGLRTGEPVTSKRSDLTDQAASERFLREQIERQTPKAEPPRDLRQTYEPETKRFLEGEIERRSPPQEPEVRYVERTVYVDRPYDRYRSGRDPHRFPWGTAYGAGIGAVIGYQHHKQAGAGAAIGGGIGLLLDLSRWHH